MSANTTGRYGPTGWGVGTRSAPESPWLTCIGSFYGRGVYTTREEADEYAASLGWAELGWAEPVEVLRVRIVPHGGVSSGYAHQII